MKSIIFLFFFLVSGLSFAQKFYQDKIATLNSVSNMGYTYSKDASNPNIYYYRQYDSYGEANVQLTFDGNYLRKIVFVHSDPKQTLTRLKDVYAKTNDSDADTFSPPSNGSGSGIASNSIYYQGRARFECNNNYNNSKYTFTVILLD